MRGDSPNVICSQPWEHSHQPPMITLKLWVPDTHFTRDRASWSLKGTDRTSYGGSALPWVPYAPAPRGKLGNQLPCVERSQRGACAPCNAATATHPWRRSRPKTSRFRVMGEPESGYPLPVCCLLIRYQKPNASMKSSAVASPPCTSTSDASNLCMPPDTLLP